MVMLRMPLARKLGTWRNAAAAMAHGIAHSIHSLLEALLHSRLPSLLE